jgi:hypothetical protein
LCRNYHGISVENKDVGVSIQSMSNPSSSLLWLTVLKVATSPEAFAKVVTNKSLFDEILDKSLVARVGEIQQYHSIVNSDPATALSGPVTEAVGMHFSY